MGKSNRRENKEDDEARQEKILEQLRMSGRAPVPPPSFFHEPGANQRKRKNRKRERGRLRNVARTYNRTGETD